MGIKKTLLGILLSASIGSNCSQTFPPISETVSDIHTEINLISETYSRPETITHFEDNNQSLDEQVIAETARSVELVKASAKYQFSDFEEVYEGEVAKRGSAILLAEANNQYYFLTAYHVVDLPLIVSSTASLSRSVLSKPGQRIENLLDLEVSAEFRNGFAKKNPASKTLTSSAATAIRMGDYDLAVGGINGGKIVCSDESLDYAIISTPSNHRLMPLSKNPNVVIGNSELITTADYTYAVGYSLALGRFTSAGNISNENLPLGMNNDLILERRDAFSFTSPISPGNSGGAVLAAANGKLYLIGIAVAYFANGQNLNIAIKINPILADIQKQGCLNITELKSGNYSK